MRGKPREIVRMMSFDRHANFKWPLKSINIKHKPYIIAYIVQILQCKNDKCIVHVLSPDVPATATLM